MKPVTLILGVAAVALVSGAGGYFLGRGKSSFSGPVALTDAARAKSSARPGLIAVDPVKLRASLDAEKSPLARFKLALEHLEAWIAKDPVGALDWLNSQQKSERRDEVIRMALNLYAETDARSSAAWAMRNLTGAELNNMLIAIADRWAVQNGDEAARWFLTQPATLERDAAVENLFFTWSQNEPAAALKLIQGDPSLGDLVPTLLRASFAGWAKGDPQAAVSSSLELGRARNDPEQFANTLANWATMDLESSSKWLAENVPAGAERLAATRELAGIYAQQSPADGLVWLGKLDSGPERDAAANALTTGWSRSSPAEAAAWAAGQTISQLAPESIQDISRNFLMRDPAAFEAWRAALPEGPFKEQTKQVGIGPGDE
ncbi:hypothetical protein JIN84_04905 [Luteolibacter yonseiensis]|uniref:Uncharacterized protein n=1 Tax=Luteolibacter yonseiensis TaxID=1144680 RepID=A0A934V6E4_9BACT|nr:hypothetical protein [Luteolibacter yonseiensis]MBK1814942.1 hypothetical protein [Luteolibacter yonseiensis]